MKTKVIGFVLLSMLSTAFQCEDKNPPENRLEGCIDPSLIKEDVACIMIYDPVCGCDGKTYGNSCIAGASGVKTFEPGECPK